MTFTGPVTTAASSAANSASYWGYHCWKDDESKSSGCWTMEQEYSLVVLKSGKDDDRWDGVLSGEELCTVSGKDISHIIYCACSETVPGVHDLLASNGIKHDAVLSDLAALGPLQASPEITTGSADGTIHISFDFACDASAVNSAALGQLKHLVAAALGVDVAQIVCTVSTEGRRARALASHVEMTIYSDQVPEPAGGEPASTGASRPKASNNSAGGDDAGSSALPAAAIAAAGCAAAAAAAMLIVRRRRAEAPGHRASLSDAAMMMGSVVEDAECGRSPTEPHAPNTPEGGTFESANLPTSETLTRAATADSSPSKLPRKGRAQGSPRPVAKRGVNASQHSVTQQNSGRGITRSGMV